MKKKVLTAKEADKKHGENQSWLIFSAMERQRKETMERFKVLCKKENIIPTSKELESTFTLAGAGENAEQLLGFIKKDRDAKLPKPITEINGLPLDQIELAFTKQDAEALRDALLFADEALGIVRVLFKDDDLSETLDYPVSLLMLTTEAKRRLMDVFDFSEPIGARLRAEKPRPEIGTTLQGD